MATKTKGIRHAVGKIFDLLKLDKSEIYSIYFYSIIAGLVSFSLPLGIQTIIGFVMAASYSTSILVLITLVLVGTFFNGFLQIKQLQLIEKIEQKLFVRYAFEYASRLPKLNIEKLDSYYLPELVNRFFDVSSLQKSLHKVLVDIPTAMFQVLIGIVLLAFYHPLFIAFGAFLMLIVILILRFTSNKGFQTSLETSDYKYKVAAWLEEMARSIKSFKYAKSSNLHIQKTDFLTNKYLSARTQHFKILKFQFWSLIGFKLAITAAMLIIGVWLLVNQLINIGQFIAADIVIILIMGSIEKLIGIMDQVYDTLTSVEKLDKIAEAEIEFSGTLKLPKDSKGVSIKFDNVNFNYDIHNEVLHNLNFSINQGEWLLLNGKSGSGKSTILRLLTGAFTNFKGSILIDGIPIRNYDNLSLRSNSGILLGQQDIFLGSLQENLSLGDRDITTEDIVNMAKLTGLTKFIESNEYGLETLIDPTGKRLPSEIRHFILLTRALLGKYRLLLLEEPFKYLSEEQTLDLIGYLKKSNTSVIIASESSFCRNYCDKILVLNSANTI
jgi:ATP-binding cassette, subfamily B, bacterial